MTEEVKNVKVKLISIVSGKFKPKNGETCIIKADGQRILKADKVIDGLMYVTVMKPNDIDSDDQFYIKKTVQKAAHDFLENGRINAVDENHDLNQKQDVSIVESYVDNNNIWKAVIDISKDDDLMEKAEKGELHGVSIYGVGEVIEKATVEKATLLTMQKKEAPYRLTRELESVIYNTLYDDSMSRLDKLGNIEISLDQYGQQIRNILTEDIEDNNIIKSEDSEMNEKDIANLVAKCTAEAVTREFDRRDKDLELKKASEADKKEISDLKKTVEELKKAIAKPAGNPDEGSQPSKKAEDIELEKAENEKYIH